MAGAAQAALRKNSISRRESVTSRGVWGQSPPNSRKIISDFCRYFRTAAAGLGVARMVSFFSSSTPSSKKLNQTLH